MAPELKFLCRTAGVEDVFADCISRKVVVKGKKAAAEPMKVMEYVHKKTGHMVELISPIPPPPEEKKEEEKKEEPEPPKPEEEVNWDKSHTTVLQNYSFIAPCNSTF